MNKVDLDDSKVGIVLHSSISCGAAYAGDGDDVSSPTVGGENYRGQRPGFQGRSKNKHYIGNADHPEKRFKGSLQSLMAFATEEFSILHESSAHNIWISLRVPYPRRRPYSVSINIGFIQGSHPFDSKTLAPLSRRLQNIVSCFHSSFSASISHSACRAPDLETPLSPTVTNPQS
jgi:hypothetical protein